MIDFFQTLVIYLILMFVLIFATVVASKFKTKSPIIIYLIPILIYSLFWGIRYDVGADFFSYQYMYHNPQLYEGSIEYGFLLLINVLNGFHFHDAFFFILVAFMTIAMLYYTGYACGQELLSYIIFFFFVSTLVFFYQNGLRQSLALSLFFLTISKIDRINLIQFLMLVVLAVSFHKSSIIPFVSLSLIYVLYSMRIKVLFNPLIVIPIILLFQFVGDTLYSFIFYHIEPIFEMLDYNNFSYVDKWDKLTQVSSGVGYVVRITIYILVVIFSGQVYNNTTAKKIFYYFYCCFLIGVFLEPILAQNSYFMRMNLYFLACRVFVYAFVLEYLHNAAKSKVLYYFAFYSLIIFNLMLFIGDSLNNSNMCFPYQTI